MALGQIEKAIYVSVKDGRLVTKDQSGKEQTHDYLEGRLVNISSKVKDFGGESVTQYLFEFKDDAGERFILSTGEKSGIARALLNSLASIEGEVGTIRVVPYLKDGYTKILLYHNGERLNWKHNELPPLEEKQVAGATIKDDTKRIVFFRSIAEELRGRVTQVSQVNR